MADISITAANVVSDETDEDYTFEDVIAGEAMTGGQTTYQKAADNKYYKADADNTAATADAKGIVAVASVAANQRFRVHKRGNLNPGATLTVGERYYVSDTAGGIKPSGDLATGDVVVYLGTATTASNLKVKPENTGATVPA